MDLFYAMRVFKRVAEIESFTKVANELEVSQSSISKQVSALEQRLGVKLLLRSTRQLNLSEAGQEYYERCCTLLNHLEQTETLISTGQSTVSGLLRINIPGTLGRKKILPMLWEFLRNYPTIELDLILDDRRIDLVKEGVDLAIRSGSEFEDTLVTRKLCDIPRLLVASSEYVKRKGVPNNLAKLSDHDCIVYSSSSVGHRWSFRNGGKIKNVRVGGRVRVNSPDASLEAALNGFGISLSPQWLVKDMIEEGSLVSILPDSQPTKFEVHAVFPERRFIPANVRVLIDYLQKKMALGI